MIVDEANETEYAQNETVDQKEGFENVHQHRLSEQLPSGLHRQKLSPGGGELRQLPAVAAPRRIMRNS